MGNWKSHKYCPPERIVLKKISPHLALARETDYTNSAVGISNGEVTHSKSSYTNKPSIPLQKQQGDGTDGAANSSSSSNNRPTPLDVSDETLYPEDWCASIPVRACMIRGGPTQSSPYAPPPGQIVPFAGEGLGSGSLVPAPQLIRMWMK